MEFSILKSAAELPADWDKYTISLYQERSFLKHLEITNQCKQRYYLLTENSEFVCGAVVYSLRVNILTFAKRNFNIPMNIIGIPASVDASPIIGNQELFVDLVYRILDAEKGVILCLNNDKPLGIKKVNEMHTLPGMILPNNPENWDSYIKKLRHPYRRRILQAEKKFNNVIHLEEECNKFSEEHHNLYLEIMKRTPTRLEILENDFFKKLPNEFRLHSYYANHELLTWHITAMHKDTYYFLFGGINYNQRDNYDSYINNLIGIIKESFKFGAKSINLGQTAEISKHRLGASFQTKNMFLYHKNFFLNFLIRLSKGLLTYRTDSGQSRVFK